MTKTMKDKTGRRPLAAYFCAIGASLLLMLLFETGTVSDGWLAVERQTEFVAATVMTLVTLGCAPLSLRFPHFKRVAEAINSGKRNVQDFFLIRLLLLGVPMFANTLLYYAFMSPRFGYMAIILLLCTLCIYPSVDNDNEVNGGSDGHNGGDDDYNANEDKEECQ